MTDSKPCRFGWKRKVGAEVSKSVSTEFEFETKDDNLPVDKGDVDWLTLVPIKKKCFVFGLEDGLAKAHRLVQEGSVLASSERYWEALKKWDEGLQYTPCDATIHEMRAQALLELCEVFPAVQSARKAVEHAPTWWIAHQTLGRTFLGLGEVRMAVKSFSRAVHLNPDNKELWEDDLMWAYSLLQKREKLEEEKKKEKETNSCVKIIEINNENDIQNNDSEKMVEVFRFRPEMSVTMEPSSADTKPMQILPNTYIQMRDLLPP